MKWSTNSSFPYGQMVSTQSVNFGLAGLKRRGGWPDDYAKRIGAVQDLEPWLQNLIQESVASADQLKGRKVRVLDAGAGPISKIGNRMMDVDLEVIAADPLALIYDELLQKFQITPCVRTQFAPAEDLSAFFQPSIFDLVNCTNALDHSFEPVRGLIEMLRVVKVGAPVFLAHNRNEAVNENYEGFHQFNFDVIDGRFVIWNKTEHWVVEEHIPIEVEIVNTLKNNWVTNTLVKRSEFSDVDDHQRRDRRLRDIYRQFMAVMSEAR